MLDIATEQKTIALELALLMVRHSWYVVPFAADKKPLTPHGKDDASNNEAQIQIWWYNWPYALVGINLERSGLICLDVDRHRATEDGIKTLAELVRQLGGGVILDTLTGPISRSPSGGLHYFYKRPEIELNNSKPGAGLDLLSHAVAFAGARYSWLDGHGWDAPLTELPAWLLERTKPKKHTDEVDSARYGSKVITEDEIQRARDALVRLSPARCEDYQGGAWLNVGMALFELGDAGLQLWDEWSRASDKYTEGACAEKWESFHSAAGPDDITMGSLIAWAKADNPEGETLDALVKQVKADQGITEITENIEEAAQHLPTAYDILTSTYKDPVWVIPDYLPAGMAILAGRPKIGKSWMAFQIALAVASGGMVFGKHISPGKVLYLALEDSHRRLQERMNYQGWTQEASKNVTMLTLDEFRKYIGFLHKEGAARLNALIQNEGYRMVVVDTLSRAFVGVRDMNDSQEVTAALSPIQFLSLSQDCLTLITDHHGKPNGYNPNPIDDVMSSTAKSAVADTVLGLYHDHGAQCHKLMMVGRETGDITLTIRWDRMTRCWQMVDGEGTDPRQSEALDFIKATKLATLSEIASALHIDAGNCIRYITNPLLLAGHIKRDEKKRFFIP